MLKQIMMTPGFRLHTVNETSIHFLKAKVSIVWQRWYFCGQFVSCLRQQSHKLNAIADSEGTRTLFEGAMSTPTIYSTLLHWTGFSSPRDKYDRHLFSSESHREFGVATFLLFFVIQNYAISGHTYLLEDYSCLAKYGSLVRFLSYGTIIGDLCYVMKTEKPHRMRKTPSESPIPFVVWLLC